MSTSDFFQAVRYFTAFDPYFHTVDNRPLTDLAANIDSTAQGVDAAKAAASVDGLALGLLARGLVGDSSLLVSDLSYPGGLTLRLSPGFFTAQEQISNVDSRLMTKLAMLVEDYDLAFAAPGSAGNSINYLVQCRYVDVDTGTDNLPTYDPFNPHAAGSLMVGILEINVKAGTEATTGAQVTPAADSGWTGVLVVSVADTTTDISVSEITSLANQAIGAAAGVGGIVPATTSVAGVVELATGAETLLLADTERAVTPSALASLVSSESQSGLIQVATNVEALALADDTVAITPAKLAAVFTGQTAGVAQYGTIQLADNATTQTGTDAQRAVTPAGLAFTLSNYDFEGSLSAASTTASGIVELSTNTEALTGTDTVRAVTPAALKYVLDNTAVSVSDASTAVKGIVELATSAETVAGSDALRVVTPAGLATAMQSTGSGGMLPAASTTVAGIVEIATNAETAAGSDTGRAVSPASASATFLKLSGGTLTGNLTAVDITATGALKGQTVQSTSAAKYKTNIEDLSGALDICSQMRGVRYEWKNSGKKDIGLIADELVEILPEVVVYGPGGSVEGIDYTHIVGLLINAVNELRDEVKALKG